MRTRSLFPERDKPKMYTRRQRHSNGQRRGPWAVMSRVCLAILFYGLLCAPWVSAQVPNAPSDVSTSSAATVEIAVPLVEENPIPTKSLLRVIRDGGPLMLPIALSYDHRVIDGAAAARFTTHLGRLLSDVANLLL